MNPSNRSTSWLSGCAAGLIGDILVYAAAGLILSVALVHAPTPQYTLKGYLAAIYAAYLPTQLPIALGEMVITGLALQYVFRQRPEVLVELGVVDRKMTPPLNSLASMLFIFCFTIALLAVGVPALAGQKSPEAMSNPPAAAVPASETKSGFTGMDESVNEHVSEVAGLKVHEPYINLESQGDVWNAVLLFGGGIAGFILGRWWHLLFGGTKQSEKVVNQQPEIT